MTNKAVLLVTKILQNRNLLECAGVAKFREDEEGCVNMIEFPGIRTTTGRSLPAYKIRMYEKPDQRHGVIFRFEFHEGKRPYFTVEDYLRHGKETVTYLKKSEEFQASKMESIISAINSRIVETIDSINHIGRYLAGAA